MVTFGSAAVSGPPAVVRLRGATALASGEAPAAPIWAVPVELSADWGPAEVLPDPTEADPTWMVPVEPFADCEPPLAVPVPPSRSTLGEAAASGPPAVSRLRGATTLASGETSADPIWA